MLVLVEQPRFSLCGFSPRRSIRRASDAAWKCDKRMTWRKRAPAPRKPDVAKSAIRKRLRPQQSLCIAARNGGDGRLIERAHAGEMADRIELGHVERIVCAHDDVIGAEG